MSGTGALPRSWLSLFDQYLEASHGCMGSRGTAYPSRILGLCCSAAWRARWTSGEDGCSGQTGPAFVEDGLVSGRFKVAVAEAAELVGLPPGKINTTEHDSRLISGVDQAVQGYNAQAAVNENQILTRRSDRRSARLRPSRADGRGDRAGAREHRRRTARDRGRGRRLLAQAPNGEGRGARHPGADPAGRRASQEHPPGLGGALYAFMRRVLSATRAGRSTENARRLSSRCSGRSRSTAASTASGDADDRRAARNGGCSAQATTC